MIHFRKYFFFLLTTSLIFQVHVMSFVSLESLDKLLMKNGVQFDAITAFESLHHSPV